VHEGEVLRLLHVLHHAAVAQHLERVPDGSLSCGGQQVANVQDANLK
jgi:hypothetical protein